MSALRDTGTERLSMKARGPDLNPRWPLAPLCRRCGGDDGLHRPCRERHDGEAENCPHWQAVAFATGWWVGDPPPDVPDIPAGGAP